MCHAKLEVTLGPHVNFIIGRNGSKFYFYIITEYDVGCFLAET